MGDPATPTARDPRAPRTDRSTRSRRDRDDRSPDPNVVEFEQELHRTNKALRELAIENTLTAGKINGV